MLHGPTGASFHFHPTVAGVLVVLTALLWATPAHALDVGPGTSARIRVLCRPGVAESQEVADSVNDLKKRLDSDYELVDAQERAEVVVEVTGRGTELRSRIETRKVGLLQVPVTTFETCYVVRAQASAGVGSTPIAGEACMKSALPIGAWSQAAGSLAGRLSDYVGENEERLLLQRPETPSLGAEYRTLTKELRQSLGMNKGKGVVVTAVAPEGPAARAGLRVRDIVLVAGEAKVKESAGLTRILAALRAGQTLPLQVEREKAKLAIPVELVPRP